MRSNNFFLRRANHGAVIFTLASLSILPFAWCGKGRADRYMMFEPEAKFYSQDSYSQLFRHDDTLTQDDAPHVTLLDPSGLIANLTDLTVEGFVRIRDPRILRGSGVNRSVACPAYYRLPVQRLCSQKNALMTPQPHEAIASAASDVSPTSDIIVTPREHARDLENTHVTLTATLCQAMGTLQHRKPPTFDGISKAGGFQLACGWSGSRPECCMEVYTSPSALCPTSACVPVPSYTNQQSEWFHLTGSVSSDNVSVSVFLTDLFGVTTVATTPMGGLGLLSDASFPFRVGAQIPFSREGRVMGSSQTDADGFSYRFFRGDVDEIRLWPYAREPVDADPTLFAFESVADSDVCSIANPTDAVLSIGVKDGDELELFTHPSYGIVAPTEVTANPVYQAASGFSSMFDIPSQQAFPLAYKVTFQDPIPPGDCMDELQNYYNPSCATYFDRPALVRTQPEGEDQGRGSQTSDHVIVERRWGQDYWWVPEAEAPGSVLHMVVSDLNRQDTVDLLGFGSVCTATDVTAGRCSQDEIALVVGSSTEESWVRFNYTLYDEPEAVGNIPIPMFQHGLLWRPHERYRIGGDSNADLLYRNAGSPMPRKIDNDGYVTKLDRSGADCSAFFCDAIKIEFPDPFPADEPALSAAYDAYVCHPSLRGPYRLLCLEWLVPPNRGWNISVQFVSDIKCPQDLGSINDIFGAITPVTTYYASIGYDATPEWLSPSEFPKFSAVPYLPVVVDPSSSCPDCRPSGLGIFVREGVEEGMLVQVKVGSSGRMEFYARDRNLDDQVDILPREDPGLPNGASLQPALPAPAEAAQNWQCDVGSPCPRPHIFRRVLFFEPSPTQVNNTYRVCFYTSSIPRDGGYDYPRGSRQSRPRDEVPADWPSVWTDRCINVRVQQPQSAFLCDGAPCTQLDLGVQEFTAGSSDCSTELEFTVSDLTPVSDGESKYIISISKDPENPGPESMTLDLVEPGELQQTYKVVWTPQVGVDDRRDGFRTCLVAHDAFFMSTQRLCFSAVVRKCKYCMREGETLEAVGRRFRVDWLQIYMANPHIKDPDNLAPSERLINLGALYTVRAGDYLELLSQRFFQRADELQRLNTDVDEDGGIRAGMVMCVMPPVCSVDCLYGTDCYAY